VPPTQCEIGSPRWAPAGVSLALFDVAGPCGTRETSSVAANSAVLATLLDGADPRRAGKGFAGLADSLGRARALGGRRVLAASAGLDERGAIIGLSSNTAPRGKMPLAT